MKNLLFVFALCLPLNCWAGVFKCTDTTGRTFYQSSPCTEDHKAMQINPKTGGTVDLSAEALKQSQSSEQQKRTEMQQQADENAKLAILAKLKQDAKTESEITQTLIKQNPLQFSAFAIPPYDPDKLPSSLKQFESRLPEIEKMRREAAQKALATGKCQRVEADDLNSKSKVDALIFLINCSSGANFNFNETELKQ